MDNSQIRGFVWYIYWSSHAQTCNWSSHAQTCNLKPSLNATIVWSACWFLYSCFIFLVLKGKHGSYREHVHVRLNKILPRIKQVDFALGSPQMLSFLPFLLILFCFVGMLDVTRKYWIHDTLLYTCGDFVILLIFACIMILNFFDCFGDKCPNITRA
jgi:hypothetical protein